LLVGDCWKKVVDDHRHVADPPVLPLCRQSVEGEQGRDDADGLAGGQRLGATEQPKLAFEVQPVAGLDLDRRHPALHQRIETHRGGSQKLRLGRFAGALHSRGDPAARFGDFLIAGAGAAHRMLVGAVAAEDKVRVAVDQAGRHPRASERKDFAGAIAGKIGPGPHPDDPAVLDSDGAVFDYPERIAGRRLHGRDMAIGEETVPHGFALREEGLLGQKP